MASALPNHRGEPRLRVYSGGEDSTGRPPESDWTLERVFRDLVLPELELHNRAPETIKEYERFLRRFCDWWSGYRIGNPVPSQITRADLDRWRQHLSATGCSARNINKHLGGVLAILRTAEDYDLAERVPRVRPLTHRRTAPRIYLEAGEVGRLYQAAAAAGWPGDRESAARWWRAALVLWCCYGFRTQELVGYRTRRHRLTWQHISYDARSPAEGGRLECPHGWLWYVPAKQRWAKPEPLVLPLHPSARSHLEALGGRPGDDRPVLASPLGAKAFYASWRRIVQAAGIEARPTPYGQIEPLPKHLRKTCATWYEQQRPGAAAYITGHARRQDVCSAHYVNAERLILQAVLELELPHPMTAAAAS